jgi:hypothetical protein
MRVGDLVTLSWYGRNLVAYRGYGAAEFGLLVEMSPLRYRVKWNTGRIEWHVRRDIKKMKKIKKNVNKL